MFDLKSEVKGGGEGISIAPPPQFSFFLTIAPPLVPISFSLQPSASVKLKDGNEIVHVPPMSRGAFCLRIFGKF